MSAASFCTGCGAARATDAGFCTSCGKSFDGATPVSPAASAPVAAAHVVATPTTAAALAAVLLVLGGVAAWFTMTPPPAAERAVAGSPGAAAPTAEGGLPSGHPSIELPKEVLDFLEGLGAEATNNPESIEAAQKLARALYRASVINASYRVSAEQALAKLLALDASNEEGLRILANLAYDAGDFPEAEKRFLAFLEKYPGDASAMTDLGSSQLFQERVDDAVATYKTAIEKDPKFMQAHFNMGIALQKQGKKEESIAALKRALELTESPEQRQHIENALAEVEGRAPMPIAGAQQAPNAGGGAPVAAAPGQAGQAPPSMGTQGGMPMPPPAPDREVATNAANGFQRAAEKPLVTHPIIGPRMAGFEWTGATTLRAKIADFPMEQMPPFALVKFRAGMGERIAAAARDNGVAGVVTVELVDAASGRVMETLSADTAAAPGAPAPPAAPGAGAPRPAANGTAP
ncbi:MAG: tetratricopeptide repeat protein [Candidatus Binatia bacterium]